MKKEAENGTIEAQKRRDLKPVRYAITQEQIDDIVDNDLKEYDFSVRPVYNPRIKDNGVTRFKQHPSRRTELTSIQIGKQSSSRREFLVDTVLHEWLEAEIVQKQYHDPFYRKLHETSDKDRHKWIYAQIKDYFDKRE